MRVLPLLVAIAGCENLDASFAEQARVAHERMHDRFEAAKRLQVAIALSDLERAKVEAETIEALDEPDFLPQWRPYVDNVRAAARTVRLANDTVVAARASAELGRRCAQCHAASNSQIVLPREPQPADHSKLGPQMVSHQWAAARMWEGIITGNDERWLTGARTLASSRPGIVAEGGPKNLGIADHAARMRLLANRALATASQYDRAAVYGDLLATCASCHFAIRDR